MESPQRSFRNVGVGSGACPYAGRLGPTGPTIVVGPRPGRERGRGEGRIHRGRPGAGLTVCGGASTSEGAGPVGTPVAARGSGQGDGPNRRWALGDAVSTCDTPAMLMVVPPARQVFGADRW